MPKGTRVPGGHVVQIERTAEALGHAGFEVILEFSAGPPPVDVDLVHGFGLDAADIRAWHTRGVPVVLSSIYWPRAYRTADGPRPSARALAGRGVRAVQLARASLRGRGALVEACLQLVDDERKTIAAFEAADLLLPNAEGEAASVRADLGVSTPIAPVPNGVDPRRFAGPTEPFEDRGYVLQVGRIEPHKNQLGLIRALENQGMPLTIAGPDHPDHRSYADRCRSAGAGWVTITGRVTDEELRELYRGARVHALPTWFETTGLVSLEAALSGCSLVSTSRLCPGVLRGLRLVLRPRRPRFDPQRGAPGVGHAAITRPHTPCPRSLHLEPRRRGDGGRLPGATRRLRCAIKLKAAKLRAAKIGGSGLGSGHRGQHRPRSRIGG